MRPSEPEQGQKAIDSDTDRVHLWDGERWIDVTESVVNAKAEADGSVTFTVNGLPLGALGVSE